MKTTIKTNPILTRRFSTTLSRLEQAEKKTPDRSDARLSAARTALREVRLDRVEAGKRRLWRGQLRLTQVVNALILCLTVSFLVWQRWAFWAAGLSSAFTVAGMWAFARWMTPREQRLRRHMVFLARHRRTCVTCGYRLCDLTQARCPECGTPFDPNDTRHILSAETLRMYSSLARSISALVILYVMFWVTALVQGAEWFVSVGLALALLAAFHLLHWGWIRQARRGNGNEKTSSQELPSTPRCPQCSTKLCDLNQPAPSSCPACSRPLTYGEVFIRPDVRRLWDRRITSIQYQSLLLRWGFLVLVCAGPMVLLHLNARLLRMLSFGMGRSALFATLGVPLLLWVVGLTLAFRHVARSLHRRLRLRSAQIHPTCRRCQSDLSARSIGTPCPTCNRPPKI